MPQAIQRKYVMDNDLQNVWNSINIKVQETIS